MPIKVWAFTFNGVAGRKPPDLEDPRVVQHAFDFNIDLHARLEDVGFEGVFFSEHHFLNSISPNPNLLVAALASRTRTLKIGVLGSVLPFHQPWRVAEDLGMLDYITNGRLEIGFAGGIATEFPFLDIALADSRPMYLEALDVLDRAAEERLLTHHGKYFDYNAVPILPRPRPETRRRKWLTVYSEGTVRMAAQRGYKICTAFQSTDAAKRVYDFYRDEAQRIGYPVTADDIGLRRQVLIGDDDAGAVRLHDEVQVCARDRINDIFSQIESRRQAGGKVPEKTNLLEGLLDPASEYLHGSPRRIAELIVEQCHRVGAGNFVAYHPPALEEDEILHHYELWREVIPMLRDA